MDPVILTSLLILMAIAVADICMSRLTVGAKILWSCCVIFLVGVGVVAWLLTRHTAYREPDPIPESVA